MTERVIVALDLPSGDAALDMARLVRDHVAGFKIGLGLLYAEGPGLIGRLAELGRPVFADAKLHDIPSQVEAGARHLGSHGARWVTAHATGGSDMLRAAVTGIHAAEARAGILAVTVLTSLDDTILSSVGFEMGPENLAAGLAAIANGAGCEGIVSSPRELAAIAAAAPDLLRVTPGIRTEPTDDDQVRTAGPSEAVAAGADLIVVGRPITQAADPIAAAEQIAVMVRG